MPTDQITASKLTRLGDIVQVVRGASPRPKGDPMYFGGKIPWIMISDITKEAGKYLSRTRECVTDEGAKKSRYLEAGTLILSNSGTVCVPKILAVNGCIHDGFVAFPDLPPNVLKDYLYYFFEHVRPAVINANRQGITQVNLNTTIVRELRVPLIPFEAQQRIVAEIEKQFSRLDEAVANLKRVKANLKRFHAAVLKAAVEGRLVPTEAELARREGRTYENGAQLVARILAKRRALWESQATLGRKQKYVELQTPDTSNLPEVPEGWTWASVGLMGDVIGGLTKNPKRVALQRQIPYLQVANVYANELRLDEMERIGVGEKELDKLLVFTGDLLIVEGNGSQDQIGRVAIWDGSIEPCVHQNHLIKVRLADGCLSRWALLWLLSPQGRNLVRDAASSTSGLYTLSVGKVAGLSLPIPSLSEQQRIVAEVERQLSMSTEAQVLIDASLRRADGLRLSVLRRAFHAGASEE